MRLQIFLVVLVSCLISKGTCLCGVNQLSLSQAQTGQLYNFAYIEYEVTVSNQCSCEQRQIKLECPHFRSYTQVDPAKFTVESDGCYLQAGGPLPEGTSMSFTYAWTQQWELTPQSSQCSC